MRNLQILTTSVAAAGLLAVCTPAQAQDTVGVNAAVRNSVQIRSPNGPLRPAQVRGPVRLGDQIVTGPQSQVQVLLRDRSTFTVGANARMTVDRFVVSENGGSAVTVAQGAFRFVSGRTGRASSNSSINTPVGSMGVRGTIVDGVVGAEVLGALRDQPGVPPFTGDAATTLFVVMRGPAGDAKTFDTPGAVDIEQNGVMTSLERPGQSLLVTSDGVFGPFDVPDEISGALGDLLTPAAEAVADEGEGSEVSVAVASDDVAAVGDATPALSAAEGFEPVPDEEDLTEFPFFPPTEPEP